MKISKNLKALTTTQSELGRCLGISQQRVNQLIKDEVVIKGEDNGVLVIESLMNYYTNNKSGKDESGNAVDFWVEKALHEKTKREIAEIKLSKMQNQIYDAKTVEMVMIEMLSNLRTQLLGIPSKLATELESKTREEIYFIMTKSVEEALNDLSEYTPDLFSEEIINENDE